MAWPPMCPRCSTQHIQSCEDAQEERQLLAAVIAVMARHTLPQPVPASLRGRSAEAR